MDTSGRWVENAKLSQVDQDQDQDPEWELGLVREWDLVQEWDHARDLVLLLKKSTMEVMGKIPCVNLCHRDLVRECHQDLAQECLHDLVRVWVLDPDLDLVKECPALDLLLKGTMRTVSPCLLAHVLECLHVLVLLVQAWVLDRVLVKECLRAHVLPLLR